MNETLVAHTWSLPADLMEFTEEEIQLMRGVSIGKISRDQFRLQFRPDVADKHRLTLELLRKAHDQKDAALVEHGLYIGFIFGFVTSHLPLLCELSSADWHVSHESVVSALDELRDERAVSTLYEAALAKHQYLDYDEFYALARKAVWALAAIGTESAMEKLRFLREGDNPVKAEYAKDQLGYLETDRKPLRFMP